MKIVTSYKAKIVNENLNKRALKDTVNIYRRAVSFFVDVVNSEWDIISVLRSKTRCNCVEALTIQTHGNPNPKYDFNAKFYKMPSYLRRAALQAAVGIVSSYRSNLKNWVSIPENSNKPPRLAVQCDVMPVFYNTGMFKEVGGTIFIKLFSNKHWNWHQISLREQDLKYFRNKLSEKKRLCPVLQVIGKQWYLRFAFEESKTLSDTSISERVIVSVDLGLNNEAAVCAMNSDGTVIDRRIFSLSKEKDRLNKKIGKIKKAQRKGNRSTPRLWSLTNNVNRDISRKTAKFIIDFAVLHNADVIVLEHLLSLSKKKKHGTKKQRLHLWRISEIQEIVKLRAHQNGMRYAYVNAAYTSRLAFDGSGTVKRGRYVQGGAVRRNNSICTFTTGKQYHIDLNAAYNVGARYFIREILKTCPETDRLALEAKVPQVAKRTTCTLSSLISLVAAIKDLSLIC